MKQFFLFLCCTFFVCIPVAAQVTLYPVRGNTTGLDTVHVEVNPDQRDRSRFVAEEAFEFRLVLEFPTKEEAGFLPSSDARFAMFWLRLESLSRQPRDVNPATFTLTDEQGQLLPFLRPEEAFDRISSSTLGRDTFLSNTRKALGRPGATVEDLKDETLRFSFQSGQIPPQGLKQGLIFFELPKRKKFTLTLRLGDLWSRPFLFTSVKPKN